ncbi:hypothetical protein [Streptomyces sp. NPDC048659]|uniref:hypothetical protein n=1 Tax=Streptomyces sp. NPDC048659 TaxID=3155489 RepID=UPI003412BED3
MEQNDNAGGGGGTNFRAMPHQQMLDWLDEASSFYVSDAGDRLNKAAAKMREIAKALQNRPGRVEWRGEAEKAFMEWANSLASTTHSLADYSEHSANWLGQAAGAISVAKSAIPRYTSSASAKENLEAARKYHNDPDSQQIARDARSQMAPEGSDAAAVKAKEEANRQAAADEMERLSGAYQWSSLQMANFKQPSFQPPPDAFVPEDGGRNDSQYLERSSGGGPGTTGAADSGRRGSRASGDGPGPVDFGTVPPSGDSTGPVRVVRPEVPVDLGIDGGVGTAPPPTTGTPPTTGGQPPVTRPDTGVTPPPVTVPGGPGIVPPYGKGGGGPVTAPPAGGIRTPGGSVGPGAGRGTTGALPTMPRDGISGGRAVPGTPGSPGTPGRPAAGLPRGTVIGNEPTGRGGGNATGRGPMAGHGMGGPMSGGGTGAAQSGISGGRRLAGETGGVVGGRPQRPGSASGRPFTPGGSGLVRGGAPGEPAARGAGPVGRGGSVPAAGRREEERGERPDYLVEDEETWQQGRRRVAPPVID